MKQKLFEISRGQFVKMQKQDSSDGTVEVPVSSDKPKQGMGGDDIIYFDHVDGMYSLCYGVTGTLAEKNLKVDESKIFHLAAWTEVIPLTLEELYGDFEIIRQKIGRSGYGKDGLGEYRFSILAEMSDDWVKNSISYVKTIATDQKDHLPYYKQELDYRKEKGINISDKTEEAKDNFADKIKK
jgi:hypothetical protein